MSYEREIFNMIIIAILLLALIAFLSVDLIISGLQCIFIIICLPFIIVYQLLKLIFSKGKKANES